MMYIDRCVNIGLQELRIAQIYHTLHRLEFAIGKESNIPW